MQTSLVRFEIVQISQVLRFPQSLEAQKTWFSKEDWADEQEESSQGKYDIYFIILYYKTKNHKHQN
jgi:hypothetical protein